MPPPRVLKNAQQVLERHEQRQTQALAESARHVKDSETKLHELERYRAVYLHDFEQRVQAGIAAGEARLFQTFIARIAQAVGEQQDVLARARTQHAEELRKWRSAARRSAAVDRIVGRHEHAEKQRDEKSEQAASDAHAQRTWAAKGARRGH